MPKFIVSWSTKAWYSQEIEADSHAAAAEAWDDKGPRSLDQEEITDDWFAVECADEDDCPEDDREDD